MSDNNTSEFIVELSGVTKSYQVGKRKLDILKDINWQIPRNKWSTLVGASGSGKTTLLNLIGLLERPDAGTLAINGRQVATMSKRLRAKMRGETIGFVFQSYQLLPELNMLENVILPGLFAGKKRSQCLEEAQKLLTRFGLSERWHHFPAELSGGEQQRAAIARSLINQPTLLLADEPTGNLDTASGNQILQLFRELCDEGLSIIMITHNEHITTLSDEVATLVDGQLCFH